MRTDGKSKPSVVLYFMDKYRIDRAYVITPDRFEKINMQGKTIFFLPAYFASFVDFTLETE